METSPCSFLFLYPLEVAMTPEMRALLTGVEALYLPVFILAVIVSDNAAPVFGTVIFTGLVLLFKVGMNSAYYRFFTTKLAWIICLTTTWSAVPINLRDVL